MAAKKRKPIPPRLSDLLRVPAAGVDLHAAPTRDTPGFSGGKADALAEREVLGPQLSTLQEQLFAEHSRRLLLVLQGLDTSGKGGTVRHVMGLMDPAGLRVTQFKRPTAEELRHDFLWRIRRRLPEPGQVGVFDRSHYEDVVTTRVLKLIDKRTWTRRYGSIDHFEEKLAHDGVRVVKVYLHISAAESRERLLARLDDPTKRWKFEPSDLETRELWDEYLTAYSEAITATNTETAPWHVVPADRKWYRNWAVTRLLIEQLEEMAPRWPEPTYDVEAMRERLLANP